MVIIKKLLILLFTSVLLVACGESENEKELREAKEKLAESQTETERLEELTNQIDETTESIEDLQEEMGIEEDEENNSNDEEDPMEYNTSEIEREVESVVASDLDNTTITELRVNEDMSIDDERYIVLVDLDWDVKNSASTTKEMLDMYSDHIAASIADNELIYELVLFWTVPYHNEDNSILKRTYENKDGGMYLTDEMKDVNVFD